MQLLDLGVSSLFLIHMVFYITIVSYVLGCMTIKRNNFFIDKKYIIYKKSNYIAILPMFTIILFIYSYGIDGWLLREGYSFKPVSIFGYRIFKIIFPFAAASIFFIKNDKLKFLIYVLLISLLFSSSSRSSIFVPVLYFIISYLFTGKLKVKVFLVNLIVIVFLLTTSLSFRSLDTQGLIGNIVNLLDGKLNLSAIIYGLNYAFSFSFFANMFVVNYIKLADSVILASLNPLPSSFIDVDNMIMGAKINIFSPTPAISMLYSFSICLLFIYMYIAGLVFSYAQGIFKGRFLLLFLVAMLLAFSVLSMQYHLRECTRILYYIITVIFSFKIFRFLKRI